MCTGSTYELWDSGGTSMGGRAMSARMYGTGIAVQWSTYDVRYSVQHSVRYSV